MKTRLLIIIGIIIVIAVIVGMSVVSPSINNFDDFIYQLKEPFDGAEPGEIVEPKLEPDINENDTVSENKKPILTQEQIDEQIDIVFGNARKSWTVFPGGAGWVPPQNSTLVRIYKEVDFGITPLDFTAMLDDKIFVNKCESNGGVWNYTYRDCEGIWEICKDIGGIQINRDITKPCTSGVCLDGTIYRISCVFEYEN